MDPALCGHVMEAKHNQSEPVVDITTADDITKAQVGTECGPFVLKILEKEIESGPEELKAVKKEDGTRTKIEEMRFKTKYNKYLNQVHPVNIQLRQTYCKYYGQINEEMKENLRRHTKRRT